MAEGADMNQIEKAMSDYLGEMCGMRLKPHALTGLAKAAIAAMQPAPQEPVAWLYEYPDFGSKIPLANRTPDLCNCGWTETPLYAHPPAQWQGIGSASDAEITRLRAALRQIQDEGDVRANAIATTTLGGSDAQE